MNDHENLQKFFKSSIHYQPLIRIHLLPIPSSAYKTFGILFVKSHVLKTLQFLDSETFASIMRGYGFATAALYRLDGEAWVQVMANTPSPWPVAVPIYDYYTSGMAELTPQGFIKASRLFDERNHREKTTSLYFPEQDFCETHLLFAMLPAPGKRIKTGELHAGLEAMASRLRGVIDIAKRQRFASEEGFREHVKALGVDLRSLIEHELRTPLASVNGYIALLESLNEEDQVAAFLEYHPIIRDQSQVAIEALEKLSLTLSPKDFDTNTEEVERFDPCLEVELLCHQMTTKVQDFVPRQVAERTAIRFKKSIDETCCVRASPRLFRWALWEVLKNGVIHARQGHVEVSVYQTDKMFVVDISDDGLGLSPGSEELVFLRFYQDPSTHASRKGKKGLGLGLYLARQIAERHLGKLVYVRKQNRTGVFRFLWPISSEETSDLKKEA